MTTTFTAATRHALRDMLDNEILSFEFQYELHRGRAALLPQLLREFAEDLEQALRLWGHDTSFAKQAAILADGVEEHLNALTERLSYKERVAEQYEEMIAAATRLALGEVVQADIFDCLDPHGAYVYILMGESEPVYIGQTGNVHARIGDHMRDTEKCAATKSYRVLRCKDRQHSLQVEETLIRKYRPRFNVAFNR